MMRAICFVGERAATLNVRKYASGRGPLAASQLDPPRRPAARAPWQGEAMADALLEVRELRTYIYTRRGVVKAVDGASFSVGRGETLGIVGESGSGKSMTCLSILRLVPEPGGRIVGGQVLFEGEDLLAKSPAEMRELRGSRIAMILQDPMASLNPALTVGDQIAETLSLHRGLRGRALDRRVVELLRQVRISDPERRVHAYPHQMSGGIRQRVAGAIAISCQPSLLIADEPTTSLDVTIQAQYLRLLKDIQRETGLAHDLRHPRPRHRGQAVRPGRRHVRGAHRGDGADARYLRPAAPSLYHRAPQLPADAPSRARAARRHRGPAAGPRQSCRRAALRARCPLVEPACLEVVAAARGRGRRSRGRMLPHRGDGGDRPSRRRARRSPRGAERGARCASASRSDGGDDDVVLEARALTKHFPVTRGAILEPHGGHGEGGRRRGFRPAARARRSGWWARAAAARRTTARLVLRLERPTGGEHSLPRPRRARASAAGSWASTAVRCRPSSRTRTAR